MDAALVPGKVDWRGKPATKNKHKGDFSSLFILGHPRIIHRDIKNANILLDTDFEALVADFGLAKLSADNNTHVCTRVMGTFGYLAPEYASSGKLTEKSDILSFGVMLLELITGKRPCDASHTFMEDSLVDWARQGSDGRKLRSDGDGTDGCLCCCSSSSLCKKTP